MSDVTPPPFPDTSTSDRAGFRFSTATLLGLTTLVAVACALAVTVPGLLGLLLALLANAFVVGLAAFLIAGAWLSTGDRRLFCVGALGCMILVGVTNITHRLVFQLFYDGGSHSYLMQLLAILFGPVEVAMLALFGGWIAVWTKRFWIPSTASLEPQDVPPPSSNRTV